MHDEFELHKKSPHRNEDFFNFKRSFKIVSDGCSVRNDRSFTNNHNTIAHIMILRIAVG